MIQMSHVFLALLVSVSFSSFRDGQYCVFYNRDHPNTKMARYHGGFSFYDGPLYADQVWRLEEAETGKFYIYNHVYSNDRIATHGSSLFVFDGGRYDDQKWTFEYKVQSGGHKYYIISNVEHGGQIYTHGSSGGLFKGSTYSDQHWRCAEPFTAEGSWVPISVFENMGSTTVTKNVVFEKGITRSYDSSSAETHNLKNAFEFSGKYGITEALGVSTSISATTIDEFKSSRSSADSNRFTITDTTTFEVPAGTCIEYLQFQVSLDDLFSTSDVYFKSVTNRLQNRPCPWDDKCEDTADWYDSDGPTYDCDWYSTERRCRLYGDGYRNFGKTANEACCFCKDFRNRRNLRFDEPDWMHQKQGFTNEGYLVDGVNSETLDIYYSSFAADVCEEVHWWNYERRFECPPRMALGGVYHTLSKDEDIQFFTLEKGLCCEHITDSCKWHQGHGNITCPMGYSLAGFKLDAGILLSNVTEYKCCATGNDHFTPYSNMTEPDQWYPDVCIEYGEMLLAKHEESSSFEFSAVNALVTVAFMVFAV